MITKSMKPKVDKIDSYKGFKTFLYDKAQWDLSNATKFIEPYVTTLSIINRYRMVLDDISWSP